MKLSINWHRIMMNLRGYAAMSMREISEVTNIPEHKLHRISNKGSFRLDAWEVVNLTDCHYDYCFRLHTENLLSHN